MTGIFEPTYSTNHIWVDERMEECLTTKLEATDSQIQSIQLNKAEVSHTHSGYAQTNHAHSGYASTNHTHSGYANENHVHDEYASTDHTHTGYASESHTHTGFASETHTHTDLAPVSHEHTGYAASTHTHSYNELGNLPTIPSLDGLATTQYVDTAVSGIVNSAPEALNTLNELASALGNDANFATTIATQIGTKVTAVDGKGLSTNDFTTAEKNKLAGIATGANKITVDTALSATSTNPVQNKAIYSALAGKAGTDHVHNVFSSLTEIGITTFPTTMSAVVAAMPQNSMVIMDTRRINGQVNDYATEIISDWGSSANGMAIIFKGVTAARVTMMIMYGTTGADHADLSVGNYAATDNRVNWDTMDGWLDEKVNKNKSLSGVDLNTITESGLYYVSSGTTALHFPVGTNANLLVMSDGSRIRQLFFRYGTINTNSFQWYSRSRSTNLSEGDNGWSEWWLVSGNEKVFDGASVLNQEINIGSRFGCQAWVFAAQLSETGTYTTVYVPRQFVTTNQTKYRFQIADETSFLNFYVYYKSSDNNVYAKVVDYTNDNYAAIKYIFRVS